MRILILADVHGKFEVIDSVLKKINKDEIDLVLCPGDFTDMFNVPDGFSQMDIADMVLQKIMSLKKPVYAVPGNHDPYEVLEVFNEYNINLHSKIKKAGDLFFVGWGGAPTPFNTMFEPSEEETEDGLSRLCSVLGDRPFGFVVHNPPKNTKLDLTNTGKHVGSMAIREFILKKQPLFTVSAHIHESHNIDMLGKTRLFYPGPVYDGFYGIIHVGGGKVVCEPKKVDIRK